MRLVVAARALALQAVAAAPRVAAAVADGGGGRGNVLNDAGPDTIVQFNWNSPIRLSPHNPSTVLVGGRQLFISRDRGQTWTMSKSLGKNIDLNQRTILEQVYSLPSCGRGSRGTPCILSRHDGYVQNEYGTITELAESPVLPGVLWAGTDDGNLQVSKDGGLTFTEVGTNLPVVEPRVPTSRASRRRGSTRARPTSRSTATATTTRSRTSSRRPTTARRGSRSPRDLPAYG